MENTPVSQKDFDDLKYIVENHRHLQYDKTKKLEKDPIVTLLDGTTVDINSSTGKIFYLVATGNRTLTPPSNAVAGAKIIIRHFASGGARTLTLSTSTNGFRFGSDITGLTATASGKKDYIGAIWNEVDSVWDVVAVSKGY